MFLRKIYEAMRRDEVAELRAEVASLRAEVDALKAEREKQTFVNEDGEHVPMSQVINEYLYGAKEAST